jgi:hypothetical protein
MKMAKFSFITLSRNVECELCKNYGWKTCLFLYHITFTRSFVTMLHKTEGTLHGSINEKKKFYNKITQKAYDGGEKLNYELLFFPSLPLDLFFFAGSYKKR